MAYDMSTAPKDGRLVRLVLRNGAEFTGYYARQWWGWVAYDDPWPLIRGDIAFRGWTPVDQGRPPIRHQADEPGAPVAVEPDPVPSERVLASRIVVARKPGRGRR